MTNCYRLKEQLISFASRKVTLRGDDFLVPRKGERLKDIQWSVSGFKNATDPRANGAGAVHQLTWTKPGIYTVAARLGQRIEMKQMIVGVDGAHLCQFPNLYEDFFYCLATVV